MASSSGVSTNAEFVKRLNKKIPLTFIESRSQDQCIGSFYVEMPNELEMLDVQLLGTRNGQENIAIWLWCKSQTSLHQLRDLAESYRLMKLLDILMTLVWSKCTEENSYLTEDPFNLIPRFITFCDKQSLQFLKTLSLETIQFQRTVGKLH